MRKADMFQYDWKLWSVAAGIRAIKTAAQSAIAAMGATTLMIELDWAIVGWTVLGATVLSLLTSVAGLPEVETSNGNSGNSD
jgi:hypothetical protein